MSSKSTSSRPIDLDEAYRVLKRHYDEGNRDISGGVPSCAMVEDFGVQRKSVTKRMSRLIDRGRAEAVRGLEPETFSPRPSYIPIEDSDGDSQ